MKISQWSFIVIALLLAISLNACQPATVTTHPPATTGASAAPSKYPYPAPSPNASASAISAYPEPPSDAKPVEVDWTNAQNMILQGNIAKVVQSHSLEVTLTTKTGELYKTTEPALDDVLKVIQKCGAPCTVIQTITE